MAGPYRLPAYTTLERRAINLAGRHQNAHDALALAADCQNLLEQAGFAKVWMTYDERPAGRIMHGHLVCTTELYYCKEDALVILGYVAYSPFSPQPEKVVCTYLAPAKDAVSKLTRCKLHRPSCIFDIADVLFRRALVFQDIKQNIGRRGVHDFEDALLHAVRYSNNFKQ